MGITINLITKVKKVITRLKKKLKPLLIILLSIILISNIPPINKWIDFVFDDNHYSFSNADGTSTFIYQSFMGGAFSVPKILSTTISDPAVDTLGMGGNSNIPPGKALRDKYPGADTVVYRLFWKNPLTFWRWGNYIFGDIKYDYPYKNWNEIKKHRRINHVVNSSFQSF